jgi:type I restriction enzyme, S subunit
MNKVSWQTKNFSDVLDIKNGRNQMEVQSDSGEYPIYGSAGNVMGYATSYICEAGTTIVGRKGNINSPIYAETRFWNVDTAFGLAAKPGLDSKFLYYYCVSFDFGALNRGTTIPSLVKSELLGISIPVPPLPEQHRIVAILDAAFDHIATAKANCEANLLNARAIFESHLHSILTQRGLGWMDRTLDQVCIVERGSSPRPIKEYFTTEPNGINWIKIGDTQEGGKYVYSTNQKITPGGAKQSRFVKEGDFILTNSMSYGRPYIMKTSGCIHDGWFVLRLNMAIDADYFYYLLSSPFVQLQFASLASGSVVKNISGDLVKQTILPIPPLEQQHMIVKKLLGMSAETQRLESLYQRKLQALDDLKKSLLHQAFSGAL